MSHDIYLRTIIRQFGKTCFNKMIKYTMFKTFSSSYWVIRLCQIDLLCLKRFDIDRKHVFVNFLIQDLELPPVQENDLLKHVDSRLVCNRSRVLKYITFTQY